MNPVNLNDALASCRLTKIILLLMQQGIDNMRKLHKDGFLADFYPNQNVQTRRINAMDSVQEVM